MWRIPYMFPMWPCVSVNRQGKGIHVEHEQCTPVASSSRCCFFEMRSCEAISSSNWVSSCFLHTALPERNTQECIMNYMLHVQTGAFGIVEERKRGEIHRHIWHMLHLTLRCSSASWRIHHHSLRSKRLIGPQRRAFLPAVELGDICFFHFRR